MPYKKSSKSHELQNHALESKIDSRCQEYFLKIQYFKDTEHYTFDLQFEIGK
jgi:hypothetical protein